MNCYTCGKGAIKLAKAVFGVDKVLAATQTERLNKCLVCPHLQDSNIPLLRRCKLCSCFINAKTKLVAESCPDNPPRWEAEKLT